MVWISVDASRRDCTPDIPLENTQSSDTELTTWVKDVAAKEIENLAAVGIRALPLPVRCCGSIIMSETCGVQNVVAEEYAFNRVCLSTAFDLARASSLQTSTQLHSYAGTHGHTFFCVMCLIRVAPKTAGVATPPMFLSFPFVFVDASNPLTHWALGNSRGEFQYIVCRNVRLPTEGSSGIQVGSAETLDDQHPSNDGQNSNISGVRVFSLIHEKWQSMTRQQKLDALSFSDSDIFERILDDFRTLTASELSRTDPMESASKSLAVLLKRFPLLSCLVFDRKMGKAASMSLQPAFVQDGDSFWSTLEAVVPKICSGKFRRRRDVSEWPALLQQPARDFVRLQQRVAQLIEQKLWRLADGEVARIPQPRRRRRKGPTTSIAQATPKPVIDATELEIASDAETAAHSDGSATEATTSTEITFDDDEIDRLLRECFIYRDDSFSGEDEPQSRLYLGRDDTGSLHGCLASNAKCWDSQAEQNW